MHNAYPQIRDFTKTVAVQFDALRGMQAQLERSSLGVAQSVKSGGCPKNLGTTLDAVKDRPDRETRVNARPASGAFGAQNDRI